MKNFKWLLTLLLQLTITITSFADRDMPPTRPLSDEAYITLLTCDPGNQLYATFGHSAIGVFDPVQRINWVFNYGTFTFNVPHFYLKFASGKLLYKLSYGSKGRFLNEYQHEGRMVVEDRLNLSPSQKQKLFDHLLENYKPENREYQYDFFFDNCATRILDIVYEALGDSLVYHPSGNKSEQTFRNLIDEYLGNKYWSDFGIDIALGSVIDHPATDRQKAFLPDYLKEYLYRCTINDQPFITNSHVMVSESRPLPVTPFLVRPSVVFWLLFAIILFLTIRFRHKSWVIGDRIIFGVWGIVGVVVLLLWVATDHDATAGNLNVMWANPFYLIYMFLITGKRTPWLKWSSALIFGLNAIVLLGWAFIPQEYHVVFIPIIGSLIIRSGVQLMRSL